MVQLQRLYPGVMDRGVVAKSRGRDIAGLLKWVSFQINRQAFFEGRGFP
jgi:hypothetical protein